MKLTYISLVLFLLLSTTQGKKKENKKAKDLSKYQTTPNVCNNEDRQVRIICTCDQNDLNVARRATCWIYSDVQQDNEFSWSHLASQSNLQTLKINLRSGAKLFSMPSDIFRFCRKLEHLEMQYATISQLPPFAFSNSSHLIDVSLARNSISELELHAVSYLQNLETINFDDNRIMELHAMVFHHVPNLRKLLMSRNNLSIVHDNAFRFLNHLHELELNSNAIAVITRETFNGLFRLRRLDLTENKLTMLGDNTFAEMAELEELELDGNKIEYISEKAFEGLTRLMRLRISRNELVALGDDLFLTNRRLLFLDVRDNRLEKLKFTTLEPLWDNFKNNTAYLLIDGNPFPCDCHLSWIYSLRDETQNKQIISVLDELTCIAPEDLLAQSSEVPLTSSEQQDDQFSKGGQSYYDDDVNYEELPEEESNRLKVIEIPRGKLPCPESLSAATTDKSPLDGNTLLNFPNSVPSSHQISFYIIPLVLFFKTVFLT